MKYTFNSTFSKINTFKCKWSDEEIKNEPMLFNCDLKSALNLGGPITKNFLENIPNDWIDSDVVIDSRVHMLMSGWYPAIPGYHHDDVPRTTYNGQPNYDRPEYFSKHLMGLVNGHIAPTAFAVGTITLPKVIDDTVYRVWHDKIEQLIELDAVKEEFIGSGVIVGFDADSFHRCTKAVSNGWRWFIRVSKDTHRTRTVTNELRNQVQVYLDFPTAGW